MITVEQFIEAYNRCVDWNREILSSDFIENHPYIKEKVDGYLDMEKITSENYEIENAVIYENGKSDKGYMQYELQMYSYETYHTAYFWVTPEMGKEEYIAGRIKLIKRDVTNRLSEIGDLLEKLKTENAEYIEVLKIINK